MAFTETITNPIVMPAKHPDGTRTVTVNLADQDGTTNDASAADTGFLQGRTISSISVTTPSGITLDSSSNTTLAFSLVVSGGTADTPEGTFYDFDVDVTLSSSDVEPVIVRIPVKVQGA